jgi:hypothetical protein
MTAQIILLAGYCIIGYGLWLVWPPLGIVFAGVILVSAALELDKIKKRKEG